VSEKTNKSSFLFVFPSESIFNEVKGTNKREQKQIISKIFVGVENNP